LDAFGVHDELVGLLAVHFCHLAIRSRLCIPGNLFNQMCCWPLHYDTKLARQSTLAAPPRLFPRGVLPSQPITSRKH
jgi:hypothetical protein